MDSSHIFGQMHSEIRIGRSHELEMDSIARQNILESSCLKNGPDFE
jgi:hypothetical protein